MSGAIYKVDFQKAIVADIENRAMFAIALYCALSTASLVGLLLLLSARNENCSCGKCDEYHETWIQLQNKIADLSPIRSLVFWPCLLLLALPMVLVIACCFVDDWISGNTDI